MIQPVTEPSSDLDLLFNLFEEDFSGHANECSGSSSASSLSDETENADETSSESSGSSGHSSPSSQVSTYYPSPPSVVFAPNPLSCFSTTAMDSKHTTSSNKRTKTEDKLIRNRASANKSRLKRKNEKSQLEETVATLREKVRTLEMENNALLTDNTTLSQHNFFLQGLLQKQQAEKPIATAVPETKAVSSSPSQSHMSALSGLSMLCVVFSVSFFNDWLPVSLQVGGSDSANGAQERWSTVAQTGSSGRVLLSVDDDDFSGRNIVSDGTSLHYVLIVSSMLLYYFYVQYNNAVHKKTSRVLPS